MNIANELIRKGNTIPIDIAFILSFSRRKCYFENKASDFIGPMTVAFMPKKVKFAYVRSTYSTGFK